MTRKIIPQENIYEIFIGKQIYLFNILTNNYILATCKIHEKNEQKNLQNLLQDYCQQIRFIITHISLRRSQLVMKNLISNIYNWILQLYIIQQEMNYDECFFDDSKQKIRQFICSCGKAYLSDSALYTHIKLKHNGKAPGKIQKPYRRKSSRGRPSILSQENMKIIKKQKQILGQNESNLVHCQQKQELITPIIKIIEFLKQIRFPQNMPQKIWRQVQSFQKYQKFLDKNFHPKILPFQQATLGYALSQFLKILSFQIQPWKFQQLLILFILIVQYIMDESNNPNILQESPVDILIQYMNPFIQDHIEDYCEYLGIEHIWAMRKINMHNIFMEFYNWLKLKNYTTFCIILIE